jgi:hypothetical protein
MLISDNTINSQKQLDSVDIMARKVGLKINRAMTELMMVGNWASLIELRVSTGTINLVKDFKYLGSWLLSCKKDFEIRKALAWKACILFSQDLKEQLYLCCCPDKVIWSFCRINFCIMLLLVRES